MVEVSELVVSARPDGMDQTVSEMENVENQFAETSEQVGDSAGELQGMATKWKGAMGAILGGLAVAAGGLLSRVPVIGETMDSMNGIISALAFKIDQDLRPALQGLNSDLRETESEVANADSALEGFEKAMTGVNDATSNFAAEQLQNEIKSLTGITVPKGWLDFGFNLITMDFHAFAQEARQIINGGVFGPISKRANTFWQEYTGVMDQIRTKGANALKGLANDGVNWIKGLWSGAKKWLGNAADEFEKFVNDASDDITDLVDDGVDWGEEMIRNFIQGVKNAAGGTGEFFGDLASGDFQSAGQAVVDVTGMDSGGGGSGGGFSAVRESANNLYLDGRSLIDNTGRYRSDHTSRRGRFG